MVKRGVGPMHTKPVTHWWDWHNWRTWSIAGIAALLLIAAAVYMTDMFGGSALTDTGGVTITEPATE